MNLKKFLNNWFQDEELNWWEIIGVNGTEFTIECHSLMATEKISYGEFDKLMRKEEKQRVLKEHQLLR